MASFNFLGYRKVTTALQDVIFPLFETDATVTPSSSLVSISVTIPQGFSVDCSSAALADSGGMSSLTVTDTLYAGATSINGAHYATSSNTSYYFNLSNRQTFMSFDCSASIRNQLTLFLKDATGKVYFASIAQITSDKATMGISKPTSNTWGFISFGFITTVNTTVAIRSSNMGTIHTDFFNGSEPWQEDKDPYSGAGKSTTGGGGGTFDGSSDPVAVPSLPSVGATNTGFISLFVPTQAQLKQVADYLWSGLFDLSTYLKIFENPMDCILGLSVVPVTVPTSGSAQITVGNIELSGISLPLASQQYVEVDCGSISFTDKYFGSYLDQDPYTKMALFVPYSGVHSVKADDIMGKTVNLKYHIDILTGSLVAFLTCGNSVLYEFNGACASNIPVNSINYASTIENAIRIAVNIGTTVATAGAAAPMTGATAATREAARTFGTAVNMAGSTAEGILSLKPNIDRAGSLGGTTGLMGNQTPYFIITRPRLCKPANQNTFKGYPSFIQVTIGDLIGEGYTEFDTVILAGLYLTDSEKEELKQILESGVYL